VESENRRDFVGEVWALYLDLLEKYKDMLKMDKSTFYCCLLVEVEIFGFN
jgi:hypothetical protein